jgi:acyl dehydratase
MAVRELSSAPSLRSVYRRAVTGAGRAAVRRLPGLRGGERELPDLHLVVPEVEVDRDHLAAYDRVCAFRLRDELPPTYPHVLAFPLQMQLMTDPSFPFPVIGGVHIRNRIEQLRPIEAGEKLTVRVSPGDVDPHDRGTQFELHAVAEAGGEPAWRGHSTYLHKESRGGSSGKGGREDRPEPPRPSAVWRLPPDLGRRYAAVSGDRNPIHLHPLSARLFGMPGMIAHGMWLKARCLAALEGSLPDSYEVDVRFKKPVPVPGRANFASWAEDGSRGFALHDAKNEKPHLAGALRSL